MVHDPPPDSATPGAGAVPCTSASPAPSTAPVWVICTPWVPGRYRGWAPPCSPPLPRTIWGLCAPHRGLAPAAITLQDLPRPKLTASLMGRLIQNNPAPSSERFYQGSQVPPGLALVPLSLDSRCLQAPSVYLHPHRVGVPPRADHANACSCSPRPSRSWLGRGHSWG